MPEPACPSRTPCLRELAAGDYLWCACGLSKDQPFCDGSHAGTAFRPIRFTLDHDKPKLVWLCGCKRSREKPFCDGRTHNLLPEDLQP